MGWPLRMFQEEGFYFVTSRCFQGRLLLRPSPQVNEVVGGVLARAVQQSDGNVRLHAFTFASNHFHLLVWAKGAALASFMQYLRANLSRKVGKLVDWSGGFWERRYSAEPVLDDAAMVGRLRYVLAHGVKEGLVERSAEWPGLTCLPQLQGPARRLFWWLNWTKRWGKRRSEDMEEAQGRFAQEWAEPVELELAPLPCWEGLSEEERQRKVRGLVEQVEAEANARGTPVLGTQAVRAQHPHTRPEHLKRSPRPLGHASSGLALKELREQYRAFVSAFREAAARWSRGDFSARFPPFSFPPRVVPGRVALVL
ncbi:transposase [Archangium lansingense]|uniref:Transposase n=1 Tax=Archangium lansingense TaxID=2995310 RepID=A0ABT4A2D3_9BACT|nr:transposase [Archangium lansinium]MCY1075808.1 transposase [Archangium lansinium]